MTHTVACTAEVPGLGLHSWCSSEPLSAWGRLDSNAVEQLATSQQRCRGVGSCQGLVPDGGIPDDRGLLARFVDELPEELLSKIAEEAFSATACSA